MNKPNELHETEEPAAVAGCCFVVGPPRRPCKKLLCNHCEDGRHYEFHLDKCDCYCHDLSTPENQLKHLRVTVRQLADQANVPRCEEGVSLTTIQRLGGIDSKLLQCYSEIYDKSEAIETMARQLVQSKDSSSKRVRP